MAAHYNADSLNLPENAPVTTWPSSLAPQPDYCWRCDAAPAATGLGCCAQCLTDLRRRTSA